MKKFLTIALFVISIIAPAKADIWCDVTNYSSYSCGYRDSYFYSYLAPNQTTLGYSATGTFPTNWLAWASVISSTPCTAGGTHTGTISPTMVNFSCVNPMVYMLYWISYDPLSGSYFIVVEFHDI